MPPCAILYCIMAHFSTCFCKITEKTSTSPVLLPLSAEPFYPNSQPAGKPNGQWGRGCLKTKNLSAQLGCSRLSFAGEEDLARLLGVQPGSASLLCLLQDPGCAVQLVLDRPLLRQAYLGLHPCQNTSTLRIAMGDVLERVIPALGHRPLLVDLPEDPL